MPGFRPWVPSLILILEACGEGAARPGTVSAGGGGGAGQSGGHPNGGGGVAMSMGASGKGGTAQAEGGSSGQQTGGSAGAPAVQGACEGLNEAAARSFTPKLFAKGDDPSHDAACTELVNPERGFRGTASLLGNVNFGSRRGQGQSVVYTSALLDDYLDEDLDQPLLDSVGKAFAAARAAGIKLLPRFYYQKDLEPGSTDAPLERALAHIEQLKPLLQENADVIAALHAGFVGAWGEWHGSTTGLHQQQPREAILNALLAALPQSRMVLVRRPSFKSLAFPGGPLTADTAFDGSELARVGHLNDCFLASANDSGTYQNEAEKAYGAADSAFTAVDGETCATNPPRSECVSAKAELSLHHWSTLNLDYNEAVLDSWRSGGCFDEIACRLGYRLALLGYDFPESAAAGEVLSFSLSIVNDGYARPFNARPLQLVLKGATTVALPLSLDAHDFAPGAEAEARCLGVTLPTDLAAGTYQLGIALPDASPALAADERYAVQLVNDVTWEGGVNWLDASLTVSD